MKPNGVLKTGQKVYKMEFVINITHWHIEWSISILLQDGIAGDKITIENVKDKINSLISEGGVEFMSKKINLANRKKQLAFFDKAEQAENIALKLFPDFYYPDY